MDSTGYEPKAAAKATSRVIATRSSPYSSPRSSGANVSFEPLTNEANQAVSLHHVYTGGTRLRVGTYAVEAMKQNELAGPLVQRKLAKFMTQCARMKSLDIMCFCFFGDCAKGLRCVDLDLHRYLVPTEQIPFKTSAQQNCFIAYGFRVDAAGRPYVTALSPSKIVKLSQNGCDCWMMLQRFELYHGQTLILGNIDISSLAKESIEIKIKNLQEALWQLEHEAILSKTHDGILRPVVLVLVGNCDLGRQLSEKVIQKLQIDDPTVQCDSVWRVAFSGKSLPGDQAFVKGANIHTFEIDVDTHVHLPRCHRSNHRDAFGFELYVPNAGQFGKRTYTAVASQFDGRPGKRLRGVASHTAPSLPLTPPPPHLREEAAARRAESIRTDLYKWWDRVQANGPCASYPELVRKDFGRVHLYHLTQLLLEKKKNPDSEATVLRKLQAVLEVRNKWLHKHGHPEDYIMPDGECRIKFLKYCKDLYHNDWYQTELQKRDLEAGGNELRRQRMKSRWTLHLQRQLGTHQLWQMVSFTGKCDPSFLTKVRHGPSHTPHLPNQSLTVAARRARIRYKKALKLQELRAQNPRHYFKFAELVLLDQLERGYLRERANAMTQGSGFGNLHNKDGSTQAVTRNNGGIVKSLLRHL